MSIQASPAERSVVRDEAGIGLEIPRGGIGTRVNVSALGSGPAGGATSSSIPGALREPRTPQMPASASDVDRVTATIVQSIPLEKLELPGEFFPAHLSVALVDAVFRSRPARRHDPASIAERYCRYFGITRVRTRRWQTPPAHRQETLGELIAHFRDVGLEKMKSEVFGARQRLPGTRMARAEYIMRAAKTLRRLGIDVLQDMPSTPPEEIENALRSPSPIGGQIVENLLMYTSDDDFVRGDVHVRGFVGQALGGRTVSAALAKRLVRHSAYELILSPRFLYLEIRRHCLAREVRTHAHLPFGSPREEETPSPGGGCDSLSESLTTG